MPDLPPIGSLWLHRESGERRFITDSRRTEHPRVYFAMPRFGGTFPQRIEEWLSWAAHADRIDKEEA